MGDYIYGPDKDLAERIRLSLDKVRGEWWAAHALCSISPLCYYGILLSQMYAHIFKYNSGFTNFNSLLTFHSCVRNAVVMTRQINTFMKKAFCAFVRHNLSTTDQSCQPKSVTIFDLWKPPKRIQTYKREKEMIRPKYVCCKVGVG